MAQAPQTTLTALVARNTRPLSRWGGIRGSATREQRRRKAQPQTTAKARGTEQAGDVTSTVRLPMSLIANISPTMPPPSNNAPARSGRPPRREEDEGRNRQASNVKVTPIGTLTKNTPRQDQLVRMIPPTIGPTNAPKGKMLENMPRARLRCWPNTSMTMPLAEGRKAAPLRPGGTAAR